MFDSNHCMSQYVWFTPLYVTICLIHTTVCHNMLDSHHCMSQYIWFIIYLMHTIWLLAVQKEDIRMIEDLDDPTTNNCFHLISNTEKAYRVRALVLNATFNNISAISWRSLLLVEGTGVHGENDQHSQL